MNAKKINWFENIGVKTNIEFGIPIKLVGNIECVKSINSTKWENFCLEGRNRLSLYLQVNDNDEAQNWNSIVQKSKEKYELVSSLIENAALDKNISKDIIVDVKANIIMYFVEDYFCQTIENIPKFFNKLMCIYESGHIPCGWEGLMPQAKGYEQIDFSIGKILIW